MKQEYIHLDTINEVKLTYINKFPYDQRFYLRSSQDASDLFRMVFDMDTIDLCETFKIAFLNNSNATLHIMNVGSGGITGALVDIRIIMASALKAMATCMILCHNHPSGKLIPSESDKKLTTKISNAAALFDIKVLDHIILTRESYYSFADQGLL
jgi:DNA repair protein RadC